MKIDFEGQVVLVTGATRGIGQQLAEDFARLGAKLILTGTSPDSFDASEWETRHGNSLPPQYHSVDFANPDDLEHFLAELENYDRIDVCVNNAGINRINYIDQTKDEDLQDIMAVNLQAPTFITRAVSRVMKRQRYGRIVNISSIWGVIGKEKRSSYTISKFGVRGLTIGSAIDLAPHNILVNSVSPGFVLTELTRSILSAQEMVDLARQVPVGRFAEIEEISKVVLFLASVHNTYVTGQNIVVDGGFVNV